MGCWLNCMDPVRSVAENSGEGCLYRLDSRLSVYIHPAHESGSTKANIWSLATKNSGRANRRVDLFPYNVAFFAFFFRLSASTFSRLPLEGPPPSLLPFSPSRCLHSREYSSIYLKMTPITQVKYTRALIYCLSIVNLFHREIPGPPLHIHASAFLFFMTILNVRFTSGTWARNVILLCLIIFSIQDEAFSFMTWLISPLLTNTLNENFRKELWHVEYIFFTFF